MINFIRGYYLRLKPNYKRKARKLYELYLHLSSTIFWIPRNIISVYSFIRYKNALVEDLDIFERKIYSQNGEDGIIQSIFNRIGTTNKYCVEFGVEDGTECNTRYLISCKKWKALQMDSGEYLPPSVKKEFVTASNINFLFQKYSVPIEFDLLSIDVDSHDYWIWKALKSYSPRVVIVEYNAAIPLTESIVLNPNLNIQNIYPESFGCGLLPLEKLGKEKGYTLIACDNRGVNSFFVRDDLLKDRFILNNLAKVYRPPRYGHKIGGKYVGNAPNLKAMVEV